MIRLIILLFACASAVFSLALVQEALLHNTKVIAERLFAPPYVPLSNMQLVSAMRMGYESSHFAGMSDEEIIKRLDPSFKPQANSLGMRDTLAASGIHRQAYALQRNHRQTYESEHIELVAEKLKIVAWAAFGAAYFALAWIALRLIYHWARSEGFAMAMKVVGSVATLAGTIGIGGLIYGYQLRRSEKEFFRLKILYENGIISEDEFEITKRQLKKRLEKSRLTEE